MNRQTPIEERRTAEGGCGVIGLASTVPIPGRHIIRSVARMRNRGNGKGGGLALVGCFPDFPDHYALNIGLLDPEARAVVERDYVEPFFDVAHVEVQPHLDDHREVGLELPPPLTVRYFVRVKPEALDRHMGIFVRRTDTSHKNRADAEDDFVYQNSFRLNDALYGRNSDTSKRAYVVSHGRNMMILKAVGYAEDIARYYCLEDFNAHVWIGHQRYPTRGRVWHPGGAHPFIGMDEALVHNGDFANFVGTSTYLKQRGYTPMFLTDTEVSVLLFDLYHRLYGYPLELIIEALAPTTERDFVKLPSEKREVYKAIQTTHMHGSPDGPWFFILARNAYIEHRRGETSEVGQRSWPGDLGGPSPWQLVGITDTSMLRPQVFALQEAEQASVAAIASERQAIDAVFRSLASEDDRFCAVPDKVWVARGGSHNDGGAFVFSIVPGQDGRKQLICTDKFGQRIVTPRDQWHNDPPAPSTSTPFSLDGRFDGAVDGSPGDLFDEIVTQVPAFSFAELDLLLDAILRWASESPAHRRTAIDLLTLLRDRRYETGFKKRSGVLARLDQTLVRTFSLVPAVGPGGQGRPDPADPDLRADHVTGMAFPESPADDAILYLDILQFPPEGNDSAARAVVRAYRMGWKRVVVYNCQGHRFLGCGLGPHSYGFRLDTYGSPGDYLGSDLHGAEVHVHGDAQDQVGQIMTDGRIVIHGNVGQTLLYGAKAGACFVMGNAAGRPLINAVGRVRAVINGTCLDYCAESFMAGAPLGGGFVCINGVTWDEHSQLVRLPEPYPGGNFFSLASGGAGYVADPFRTMDEGQLNGARYTDFTDADWEVLAPYLAENEAHFGISAADLLAVEGQPRHPAEVYRKVVPHSSVLFERSLVGT